MPFKKETEQFEIQHMNKLRHEVTHANISRKKKKQSKEEGYLKKGSITHCTSYIDFSGWPLCDIMRKLMFTNSMFCLFLWQLVQVFLWLRIRPSGTFFFFNFSPIRLGSSKSVTCWMLPQMILISWCAHHPTTKTIIVFCLALFHQDVCCQS